MRNLKILFLKSLILLFNKKNFYTTIFSLLLSSLSLGILLLCFWNLLPSLGWMKGLFFGIYDYLFNYFWFFIISTTFVYLFPPISTIVNGFFLEKIVNNVNYTLGSLTEFKFEGAGLLGGILAGVRILLLTTIMYIFILLFKLFFFSNFIITISLYFIGSSLIIGREYYEIVAVKYFNHIEAKEFKRKNFLNIFILGMICNLFFLIPLLNLLAPILSTILVTLRFNQLILKYRTV